MKTLLATAFLLCASSLVAAHAEWEILDPGMPGSTATATSTSTTVTASPPATSTIETAKREPTTK